MATSISDHQDFTQGNILKELILFALPVMLTLFLQSLYGAVDLAIVGQFASSADLSGVSTGSQIMFTLTDLIISFSMGTSILLGQKIGSGEKDECGKLVGTSIALFFLSACALTVFTVSAAPALAYLLSAPPEAFDPTVSYVRICGLGFIIITAYNLIGGIFRGMGNSRLPLITVLVATFVNIIGDLFLVAVLHLGAAGAAIATVAAQAVSVICSFLLIRRQTLPFRIGKNDIRIDRRLFARISALGLPLSFSNFMVSLSFLIILKIVNSLGVTVSAGVGVAEKVCLFIMLVTAAFAQSMAAFTSQNYGAGKYDRAIHALRDCILLSLSAGIILGYLTYFHGDLLAGIFSKDPYVVAAAWEYLKAYAIDCPLAGFMFCFIGFFNGLGYTRLVMIQGIVGAFGARVPFSFAMSRRNHVNLFLIGLATPCSSLLQIIVFLFALRTVRKRFKKKTI